MTETPKLCPEPPDKLLASMAMRYDHGFGLLAKDDHARASILTTMRQLWEEVAGVGFYQGPGTLAEANSKLAESEAKVKELEAKLTTINGAARSVLQERARQISEEGWSAEHDDDHDCGQLAVLASAYACFNTTTRLDSPSPVVGWAKFDGTKSGHRRHLVKAGALILAEIERLDRIEARKKGAEHGE